MTNILNNTNRLFADIRSTSSSVTAPHPTELTPIDLDDEELEAYAEECARRAALADFEDIPEDELFSLSDVEELEVTKDRHADRDIDMMH